MKKYLRLLNYENACKVIDFVNKDESDYANIVVGGVSLRVSSDNWDNVETFIKSLNVRYEIGDEAPYKVEEKIINNIGKEFIDGGKNDNYYKEIIRRNVVHNITQVK